VYKRCREQGRSRRSCHRTSRRDTNERTDKKRTTTMAATFRPPGRLETFVEHGRIIFTKSKRAARDTDDRRFLATFGVSPLVCLTIWNLLIGTGHLPEGAFEYHLLWGLLFLKLYCAETIHAAIVSCDEKTF